jgi:hypothetical protein
MSEMASLQRNNINLFLETVPFLLGRDWELIPSFRLRQNLAQTQFETSLSTGTVLSFFCFVFHRHNQAFSGLRVLQCLLRWLVSLSPLASGRLQRVCPTMRRIIGADADAYTDVQLGNLY